MMAPLPGGAMPSTTSTVELRDILITDRLASRPSRPPDHAAETRALKELARSLSSGGAILQNLSEVALQLCFAHSAGVSLLETDGGEQMFRWRGLAGEWAGFLNGGLPRHASPCGVVLDLNRTILVDRPGRHFVHVAEAQPELVEGLLAPFQVLGETVGTVWVLSHTEARRFDREDARIVESLAQFAGAAYLVLESLMRAWEMGDELSRSNSRLMKTNEKLWAKLAEAQLLRE
jgi:hypothetical protein